MVLIKEITLENFGQFKGLPVNVMVVESKAGPVQMKHSFYLVGMVYQDQGAGMYWVQFSQGSVDGPFSKIKDLIVKRSTLYRFFYIEINLER